MKRRDLLTGLALTALEATAQVPAGAPVGESLYIPKPQLVEDRRFLHDFMDEFAFVDLVTAAPVAAYRAHFRLSRPLRAGPYGAIHGHVSRQNPQNTIFDGKRTA
jgi:predicted FMN-binding regulatory protein PaiB